MDNAFIQGIGCLLTPLWVVLAPGFLIGVGVATLLGKIELEPVFWGIWGAIIEAIIIIPVILWLLGQHVRWV